MSCPLCTEENKTALGIKNGWTWVRCTDCGLSYIDPLPTSEELRDYYSLYGVNKKNIKNANRKVRRFKRKFWPLLFLTKGRSFLDVGCNTGFAVEAARSLGCEATGIDLSDEAIDIAKKSFKHCRFFNVTIEEFAKTEKQYDIISCAEVIEHVTDAHSFLDKIHSLLKAGGILYLTTPDAGHFRVPKSFLEWNDVSPPQHTMLYTKKNIKKLMSEHGLDVLYFQPMLKPNIRLVAKKRKC
ncbi:MAG: class I SAM-dependent methyltransferase [Candidatus Sedimenticola sp. (ex Thyasira tokunagai)]